MRRFLCTLSLIASCTPPAPTDDGGTVADAGAAPDDAGAADPDGGPTDEDGGSVVGPDGGLVGCPLSAEAQTLLEHAAAAYALDADLVGEHMQASESAYAMTLLGSPGRGRAAFAFLAFPCDGATTFDPYCEPDAESGDTLCSRLGCERAQVLLNEVWWADPGNTAPGDDHALVVPTTAPAGEAVWDPNPQLRWRADITNADDVLVAAAIDHQVTITPTGGQGIDASHAGELTARRQGDDLSIRNELSFPGLGVELIVAISSTNVVSGGVTAAGQTIATAVAGAEAVRLEWAGVCAD